MKPLAYTCFIVGAFFLVCLLVLAGRKLKIAPLPFVVGFIVGTLILWAFGAYK